MNKKLFIPLIAFMLLAVVFVIQLIKNTQGDDPTKLESVLIGQPVPTFSLMDLADPTKQYEQSIFTGQPMLLNVWATWCPTCYAEHQYLNELAKQGVKIIGLNYKDDRAKAFEWLTRLGNPYLITLYDGDGMLGLDLGVYGAPETFIIDAKGIIQYRHVGDVNAQNWRDTLQPISLQLNEEAK